MGGQASGWMRHSGGLLMICWLAGCAGGSGESMGGASVAGSRTDGGAGGDAADGDSGGGGADGVGASQPICTSGTTWMRGNHGSSNMNPGRACLACHATMHGPALTFAGTVYPTAHEPDLCDGADGSDGAEVVITGADGNTVTLKPGPSGNFDTGTPVMIPFTAKIVYMGRERAMTVTQTSGDCNGCHTQSGANGAPGRIVLP